MAKKVYNPYPLIVNAMRLIWLRSPTRKQALNRCKAYEPVYKKDGSLSKKRKIIGFRCEKCGEVFEKLEVHHIVPVGNIFGLVFNEGIQRMFCPADELLCVCKQCHLEQHGESKTPKKGRKK